MRFRGNYWFLSNMYQAPIQYNSIVYPCVECCFQAQKCPERSKEFAHIDGFSAKKLGRLVKLRPDWEQVKDDLMLRIVRAKFMGYPELGEMLMNVTGDIVEENDWRDTYWGVCNGSGQNKLGKILMKIRDELIEKSAEGVKDETPVQEEQKEESTEEVKDEAPAEENTTESKSDAASAEAESDAPLKVYTSYFAKVSSLPADVMPISISRSTPEWFKGLEYKAIAPPWSIVAKYKQDKDEDAYMSVYSETLAQLDPEKVLEDLKTLSCGKPAVALLCYEKPTDFCHRHLAAGWLTAMTGVEIKEFEFD